MAYATTAAAAEPWEVRFVLVGLSAPFGPFRV